jgi:hypothetical protein
VVRRTWAVHVLSRRRINSGSCVRLRRTL